MKYENFKKEINVSNGKIIYIKTDGYSISHSIQYGVIDEFFNVALNGDLAEQNKGELVSLLNDYVSGQSASSNYIKWHEDDGNILLGQMIATPKVSVSRENFSSSEYTITPSNSAEFKATVTFEGGEIGDITYQWMEYDYKGNNGVKIEGASNFLIETIDSKIKTYYVEPEIEKEIPLELIFKDAKPEKVEPKVEPKKEESKEEEQLSIFDDMF